MVTKIISTADLHIHNLKRLDETKEQFEKFLTEARSIANENGVENTRIVVCGDLVHSKTTISSECNIMLSWFLNELDTICKTIIVAGNHDLNMSNLDRVDSLTPVFEMSKFKQVIYIDKELGYKSGYLVDDNIIWCLYSTFDLFNGPDDIEKLKLESQGKTFIGLFHGDCNGAKNASGFNLNGISPSYFNGTDFVIAGHIHKNQEIIEEGTKIVYCGSLIQQDMGEAISGHGFIVWDVAEKSWNLISVPNENYGYYKFKIDSESDLDNDKERIINE